MWERDRVGVKKKAHDAFMAIERKICEKDARERYEKGVIYILI